MSGNAGRPATRTLAAAYEAEEAWVRLNAMDGRVGESTFMAHYHRRNALLEALLMVREDAK